MGVGLANDEDENVMRHIPRVQRAVTTTWSVKAMNHAYVGMLVSLLEAI